MENEEEAFMEQLTSTNGKRSRLMLISCGTSMFNQYLCDLRSTFARLAFTFVFAPAEDVKHGSINDRKNTGTILLCLINGNDISSSS